MCVILQKYQGAEVPYDALVLGAKKNPHGYGVAIADRGEISTYHGYVEGKPEEHAEAVAKLIEEAKDLPVQIHFRYATVGEKTVSNTHPFNIMTKETHGVDLVMMHNGTMQYFKGDSALEASSDTKNFVDRVGIPLFEKYWASYRDKDNAAAALLADTSLLQILSCIVGPSGVLTFLSGDGVGLKVNQGNGKGYDWGWASNHQTLEKEAPRTPVVYSGGGFRALRAADPTGPVVPWEPANDSKTDLSNLDLIAQAEAIQEMIKESPNSKIVLPTPGVRVDAKDFLGKLELSDLAYLDVMAIRDLVYECPEAAAAIIMDMIHLLYVQDGKVKPTAPVVQGQTVTHV